MIMKWLHDDNEPASLLLQTCKQKKTTFFPVFKHLHAHAYVDTCKLVLPLKCFKSSTNLMDRCISKFLEVQFYIFSDRKISFLAFTHNPLLSALLQFFFFFFFGGGGTGRRKCSEKFYNFSVTCQLNRTGNIHLLQLPVVPEFYINVNVFSHYL